MGCIIHNPTGKGIRGTDKHGSGWFGASRGNRIHTGADFICVPGQDISAPFDGKMGRSSGLLRRTLPIIDTQGS